MGFRGPEGEKEGALVIAARTTHVINASLRLYWRIQTKFKKSGRKNMVGNTRVMAVTFKMKNWYLIDRSDSRGRGEQSASSGQTDGGGIDDSLTLMTVHIHFSFAKKQGGCKDWATKWATWWDKLAEYIVKFKVRILTGDFNMALFRVIPELRARSIPANITAAYMFKNSLGLTKIDSTAIFIIGPLAGATLLFDDNWILQTSEDKWSKKPPHFKTKLNDEVKDAKGLTIEERPRTIPKFKILGQGYELNKYQPKDKNSNNTNRNEHNAEEEEETTTIEKVTQCVRWTFDPCFVQDDGWGKSKSPVTFTGSLEHIKKEAQRNSRNIWTVKPTETIGEGRPEDGLLPVWKWPEFPVVKQKLVDPNKFDIDVTGEAKRSFMDKGAHMPLLMFTRGESRRSPQAMAERNKKSKAKAEKKKERNKSQSPHNFARSSGSAPVGARRGWTWKPKTQETRPAAVAAGPGVPHLVLHDYFPPPGATAVSQPNDTDIHAIIRERYLAGGIRFGAFPTTDAMDYMQEAVAQNMNMTWFDLSHPPVAQPHDGLQPMYVPNDVVPSYLPSQ